MNSDVKFHIEGEPGLIAVAMSGGVDSSVAAYLLKEQGYQVVGVTMKLWDAGKSGALNDKTCCTLDSSMDARRVCDHIGIPHYTLDMINDFEERVIDPFYEAYMNNRTPNPCVNCNSFVKWDALWNKVKSIGASHLATGHYAETLIKDERVYIKRGEDRNKDQSYFLWGIPPEILQHTIFPVTGIDKAKVREIASLAGLKTADKKESMDICFIPDGNKDRFLRERAEAKGDTFTPGPIVGPDGQELGDHNGLPFYTVGQRKGLGVATGERVFVKKMDRSTNTLLLGRPGDLAGNVFGVEKLNWFSPEEEEVEVQVRYRSKAIPCELIRNEKGDGAKIKLSGEAMGISPGQSAVFYNGDRVIGGGIITEEHLD